MSRARRTGTTAGPPRRLAALAPAGLIAVAAAATYWNSLAVPFFFDDFGSIVYNTGIRDLWRPGGGLWSPSRSTISGRPVAAWSLAINYAMGALDPRPYHLWNIAVHAACGVLLFAIVKRTLETPGLRPTFGAAATGAALAAALLWTLHPLNSEAVDYVVQRTESMAALFLLLTLYAGIRSVSSPRPAWWLAAGVVSCALGMGCKESAAVAPFLLVLYDGIFLFGSVKEAFRRRWRWYSALAATWILLWALNSSGPRGSSAGFANEFGVSSWMYLKDQAVMVTQYLRRAVWPDTLVVHYGFPWPLTMRQAAPYGLLIVSLLALTVVALIRAPALGFLGAWFFLTLAPASSVIPIATEVGAERRMYLPLMSLIVLVVAGGYALCAAAAPRRADRVSAGRAAWYAAGLVLASLAVALGFRTAARNRDYASSVSLYRAAVEGWPTGHVQYLLGKALINDGSREEAVASFRQAAATVPLAHYELGLTLVENGSVDEGIAHLRTLIELSRLPRENPDYPAPRDVRSAHDVIGRALAGERRWTEAAGEFRLILAASPSDAAAHHLLADALFAQESLEEAGAEYRAYLTAQPDDSDALNHLGIILVLTGKTDDAVEAFRHAIAADARNSWAERNLANALLDRHDAAGSLDHARRAVAIAPDDALAHDVLGRALAVLGGLDEAIGQFERSLQINPADAEAREHLERARRARGR